MIAKAQKSVPRDPKLADEWKNALNQLAAEVVLWANEENWSIHKESRTLRESGLGSYRAPVIRLKSAQGEIWIEPTARFTAGTGEGRVDITGWPSHSRATLIRQGDRWKIYDERFKQMRRHWSKQTLADLIETLQ